jgi:uncharacterized protein
MNHFVEGLFEASRSGVVHLIAGRRKSDGHLRFPVPHGPEAHLYERIPLAEEGALWSFTVQRFRPKSPPYAAADSADFDPFVVGYVELPEQLIIQTRIETANVPALHIGMKMRAGTTTFRAADGRQGLIPIFRPVGELRKS